MEMELNLPFCNINDIDLLNLINHDQHMFPLDVLKTLNFTNFCAEEQTNHDVNLFRPQLNDPISDYIFPNEFPTKLPANNYLKILSFNICSVPKHFDSLFDQYLIPNNIELDVIGLCETRLNNYTCNLYKLDNYSCYFQNKNSQGGGLAIYLHSKFQGVMMKSVCLQLPHIETLFINISKPVKFVTGIVYRPPNSSFENFLESIEEILSILNTLHLKCYLMGDFNVNMLLLNDNVINYINLFQSCNYTQTITKPTRVTNRSATLLDQVWTNDMYNYICSCILYISISDHFPVLSMFNIGTIAGLSKINITKRVYNEENINDFREDLKKFKWSEELSGTIGCEDTLSSYLKSFKKLYDKNFPLKSFLIKEKHLGKPYITQGIIKSINYRNKLQKLYAKWPLTYSNIFKNYRNTLTAVIRKAKENYFKEKLNNNVNNMKETWKTINHLMGEKNTKLPSSMDFHNRSFYNNGEISEHFNNYFCNIANDLAANIDQANVPFESFLPDPVPFSFFLRPTTIHEVSNVIKDMKNTSPGYDDVNMKIIKECNNVMSPFLTFIINKCFAEGCFPKQLQVAKIIPIYKKGEKSKHCNYRPISILPSISKIFEKIFATRLTDYFNEYSLFTSCQYGFRPKYSTDLAIYNLCQSIYDTLDRKSKQITVFCDLTKAFDTISHNILLKKLVSYGIRGKANDFIRSYLSSRMQYTVYNDASSSYKQIKSGVPQGSILGPLLFLIYVNDLVYASDKLKFLLFADDTTVYIQGQSIPEMVDILNDELIKISDWLISNKLTFNPSKTFFMISSYTNINDLNVNIRLKNNALKRISSIKFLGVTIDDKLTWKPHLQLLCNKISQITGTLYRIRNWVTLDCLKLIYYSTAYQYLIYCSSIWGGAYSTLVEKLFVAQKKLMRIMFHKSRFDHTDPIFCAHNILKVPDLIALQTCIFVFKSLNIYPNNNTYKLLSQNVNSRRPNDLRVPLCRTVHAQRSVSVRGVTIWNDLPQQTKVLMSFYSFKNNIKRSLIKNYERMPPE